MSLKTIECVNAHDCSGCGLCSQICPKNCISMKADKEGFLAPDINKEDCIECGLCLKKCPVADGGNDLVHHNETKYFCSVISDKEMLIRSSSGGMFGILAESFIERGGYVCGCVYNENMEAVHVVTNKKDEVLRMYGSKYVQSRIYQCFGEIKSLLKDGKPVLLVGTACQIAAVRRFLGKDSENLLCVEILCHGVPSPALFSDFVGHLEKKLGGRILDVRFRDKEKYGWGSEHRTCVVYEKKGKIRKYRPFMPSYFSAFFYGLNLRESCYRCKFAKLERIADITIGDFWGAWAKYGKRFEEGISVVGINSDKGQAAIDQLKAKFEFYNELSQSEAIKSNDNFEHPIKRPVERTAFYNFNGKKRYKGLWKKAYLTRTYRRKTLASVYGAVVPAKIRFALHKMREKR